MIYLFWISVFLMTYICGRGFLGFIHKKRKIEYSLADYVITGFLISICIAEIAHLTALFTHRSFQSCMKIMGGLYIAAFLAALIRCVYESRKNRHALLKIYKGSVLNRTSYYLMILAIVIIVIQFVIIQVNEHVYVEGDMLVETANTFLYSDGIYTVNPLTGAAYTEGVPTRIKILCLPSLYGFLSSIFHINMVQLVWQAVPAFVMLVAYMVYFDLAKLLFPENIMRRNIFFLLVTFFLTVGDYRYGMDGFMLLQSGFRGVAIRSLILMPYTVLATFRREWILCVLCIAVECSIAWTLYGAGVCLFVAAGLTITEVILKKGKRN